MNGKKADGGTGLILLILIIALFLGWLINEGWKECRSDTDCKENQYCTSRFECKDIPVLDRASPSNFGNSAAWIIGICLIIAAIIIKWDSIVKSFKRKPKSKEEEMSHSYHAETEGEHEQELEQELHGGHGGGHAHDKHGKH